MQPAERHRYTEDEYIELERSAETKSELVNGEIFAMSGAKPRHNALAANIMIALGARLRAQGSPCVVFTSDQRVRSEATGIHTYPDVSVACGPLFHAKYRDTLINPTVLIEVLSTSTEGYDRGAKFAHYRTIQGFVEYVLVSQRGHRIEHFRRLESRQWLLTLLEGDEAVLELPSLGCTIPLGELYAQTDLLYGDDDADAADPRAATDAR
jgi:Uma2 family endonuclease